MRIAFTRSVPDTIARCELTHLDRAPIDLARAVAQHEQYERTLRALGCELERLPPAPDMPDSVFVEDAAVVLDEAAVVTLPGVASRRAETASVACALARYRSLRALTVPATMDGGDVLRIGRRIYVGLSGRTNEEGARQLAEALRPFGYRVATVAFGGCLHLKSAVTAVDDDLMLCNPAWIDPAVFDGTHALRVPSDEPFAANVLRIGAALVCAAEHRRTADMLATRGYDVHPVDASELAKAEGGVTCCSLIVEHDRGA